MSVVSYCIIFVNLPFNVFIFKFSVFSFHILSLLTLYVLLKNLISAVVNLLISAIVHVQVSSPYVHMDI
jgi:hypothetical protein